METTISFGRVAGIRVGVHWSVIAIWWLLTWSLSTELLPDQAPGNPPELYWLAGACGALVLLGCLLAHELSHALVARRHGVATEAITLWVFGGVAQLSDEAPSPRVELLVAAAGPAASVALAAGATLILVVLHLLSAPAVIIAVVGWLALVNVALAVFNLLPGFPLDGGRVLRAWLWRRSGDRFAATRSAARAGRGLGYGLIALGLLEFTAGYWGGLWLVFIGWFLVSAATAESELGGVREALEELQVHQVMTPEPDVAPEWVSVANLLDDYVLRYRHSSFPVHDRRGRLTGLVTLSRVKQVPAARRSSTPVSAVAVPMSEATVAQPTEPLIDLLARMPTGRERRALVLDARGGLVGIVTPTDIARAVEYAALTRATRGHSGSTTSPSTPDHVADAPDATVTDHEPTRN